MLLMSREGEFWSWVVLPCAGGEQALPRSERQDQGWQSSTGPEGEAELTVLYAEEMFSLTTLVHWNS